MKLSEVCEFIVDCPHSTAVDEGIGYPLIRTPNVGKGRLILDSVHRVSEETYQKRNARAVPKAGDLIFAREAPAGNVALIQDGQKVCLGQRTVLIRPDTNKVDAGFLTYYILAPEQQYRLLGSANGATVAHVNLPVIRNLEISLPDILVQKVVSKNLIAYDDLIENNQKQIKLLEECAKRLYKEWFVDLRFPGHEQTKIVDGVPEGWKKCCIGDLISYEIGGGWGEETPTNNCIEEAYVIRGTDLYNVKLGRFEDIPCRFHSKSNLNSRRLCDGDIIFEVSGGSKNTGAGRSLLIRTEILNLLKLPVMCASFCKLIRLEDNQLSQYFYDFLQYCKNNGITEKYDMRSASSIVNYRWKDFLTQEKILMPPNEILKYYSNFAEANYHKMMNCALQINLLQNARDRLLPKLMNGEIEL